MVKEAAKDQQQNLIKSDPGRGDIRDRNGELLAYSVESYRVIADPKVVTNPREEVQEICAALMDCTIEERAQLEKRLSTKSRLRARPKLPGDVSAGRDAPAGVDPPAHQSARSPRC